MYEIVTTVKDPISSFDTMLDTLFTNVDKVNKAVTENNNILNETGKARWDKIIEQLKPIINAYDKLLSTHYKNKDTLGECNEVTHPLECVCTYNGHKYVFKVDADIHFRRTLWFARMWDYSCSPCRHDDDKTFEEYKVDFMDRENLSVLCKEYGVLNVWNELNVIEKLNNKLIELIDTYQKYIESRLEKSNNAVKKATT